MTTFERLRRVRPATVIPLVAVALFGQGCETFNKGIYGTEYAEITPFAQKTVEVIAVENMRLNDTELVWLRDYADEEFVDLDRMQAMLADLDLFRAHVVGYSVELVRVSELYQAGKPRVEAYADSVEENLRDPVINHLGVSELEWNDALENIRAQENFLAALRAFQPIVSSAGEFYDGLVDDIEDILLSRVRTGFDKRIQKDFSDVIEFGKRHYRQRNQIFTALRLVDDYQQGDKNAIVELRIRNYAIDPELLKADNPGFRQLRDLQLELEARLAENTQVLQSFEKDRSDYFSVYKELDAKVAEVLKNIGIARLQFHSWARAHQALANGVEKPGEWMELAIKAGSLAAIPF